MNESERAALFADLYRDYRAKLLRLCRSYLSTDTNVDDLFQEVMLRVWTNLPSFRHQSQPGTWLYRIAVNTALLYRRKQQEHPQNQPEPPSQPVHQDHRLLILDRLMQELPPQDRVLLTLYLEGFAYKEIAEILGISVDLTGVRLSRIKHALEQRWKEINHHERP